MSLNCINCLLIPRNSIIWHIKAYAAMLLEAFDENDGIRPFLPYKMAPLKTQLHHLKKSILHCQNLTYLKFEQKLGNCIRISWDTDLSVFYTVANTRAHIRRPWSRLQTVCLKHQIYTFLREWKYNKENVEVDADGFFLWRPICIPGCNWISPIPDLCSMTLLQLYKSIATSLFQIKWQVIKNDSVCENWKLCHWKQIVFSREQVW